MRKSNEERFWSKVERLGPDECWPWRPGPQGSPQGYACFWMDGQTRLAHRVAWFLAHGEVWPTHQVDHMCHNADPTCPSGPCPHRLCMNPAHLTDVPGAANQQGKRNRCRRALHPWVTEGVDYVINPDGRWRCLICQALNRARVAVEGERHYKTVCKRGHDLTDPDNVFYTRDGRRGCRLCRQIRQRIHYLPS